MTTTALTAPRSPACASSSSASCSPARTWARCWATSAPTWSRSRRRRPATRCATGAACATTTTRCGGRSWPATSAPSRSTCARARGQALAARLCAGADVVLENFRPGTMEKWGLGPRRRPRRATRAPSTRACRATARPGRYRDRARLRLRRRGDRRPAPHQRLPGPGAAAQRHLARRHARRAVGLPGHPARPLRARRARRGRPGGRRLDHRRLLRDDGVRRSSSTRRPASCASRPGTRLPRIAPCNVYRSSDGRWVVIAANHDTLWRRLAALMGRPELGEDERFATHHARGEHEDELDEMIGGWAAQHTAAELDRIVNEGGVVCAPVYSAADIAADPYFRERGLLVDHVDEVHGEMRVPGVVPKLSGTPGAIRHGGALDGRRRHGRGAGRAGAGRGGARPAAGRGRDLRDREERAHGVPAGSGRGRDVHRPVPGGRRRPAGSGG